MPGWKLQNMIPIFQKINTLKQQSFMDWPIPMQRSVLVALGILLFFMLNKQLFNTAEQISLNAKKNIDELTYAIKIQQKVIAQAQLYLHQKNNDKTNFLGQIKNINLSGFMAQLSESSVRNHLDIQAIKPMVSQKLIEKNAGFIVQSFQISVIGEYKNLLEFMRDIGTFPLLVVVGNFQIKAIRTGGALELSAVLNLYLRES